MDTEAQLTQRGDGRLLDSYGRVVGQLQHFRIHCLQVRQEGRAENEQQQYAGLMQQAWELKMEKSAEKWGAWGLQKLKLKVFNKNKM